MRASAAKPPPPGRPGGTAPPAAAKTPRTCPAVRSAPGRSARPTPPRTARLPPVAVRHADLPSATGGSARTGHPPTRAPTTTTARPGTPWRSLRCSTGSSRTCAATSATTSSTSPPSNRNGGSPRTSTSPCAAPWPAPRSAASWPLPTIRSGGPTPAPSNTTATSCPCGTRDRGLPRPGHRGSSAQLGPGARRARRPAPPRGPVRGAVRADGVLAGSKDAARCIGYLTKYLTKQVGDCHHLETDPQRAHAARLAEALRFQPCSPTCANWLRYGIQPKNARPGLVPGCARAKPTTPITSATPGGVLVSRKWSGKTLADHRTDRKEWLLATLGVSATEPARYAWEVPRPLTRPHGPCAAAAARRRRPCPMASCAHRGAQTGGSRRA